MALEIENSGTADNEDDDVGCYFLQPSASPYNITEKVQQANFDLFNSTPEVTRSIKVKFREELVSFEPDMTDDDVNSIESDHIEEDLAIREEDCDIVEEINEPTPKMFNTILRNDTNLDDTEEETAFEEEVLTSDEEPEDNQATNIYREIQKSTKEVISEDQIENEINLEKRQVQFDKKMPKTNPKRRKSKYCTEVHCKDHCIEKIDKNLSISIKKLEIHEKSTVNLPPLQLHQRQCCDDVKLSSSSQNLPNYNGYRSEYGLTYRQLKNKNRHLEMIKQKELARQKLIEQYRHLKVQQNETVFCQWLKEVSRRNKEQTELKNQFKIKHKTSPFEILPKSLSPMAINNNKHVIKTGRTKERPKTAGYNEFVPKTNVKKKRPHTTQSCVYIEVPQNLLKKGIYIGDLLVTNSMEIGKKLHILTVS